MEKYKFTFTDIANSIDYLLKYEPDGWKSYGVNFGREEKLSNVVKSYTNDWLFIKEDADYLKNIVLTRGTETKIKLTISKLQLDGWAVQYEGYVDLTQLSWDVNTCSAPITEGGFFKTLEANWGTEYEIDNDCLINNFNGNIFSFDARLRSSGSRLNYEVPLDPEDFTQYVSFSLGAIVDKNINENVLFNASIPAGFYTDQAPGGGIVRATINEPSAHLLKINRGSILRKLKINADIKISTTMQVRSRVNGNEVNDFDYVYSLNLACVDIDYLTKHGAAYTTGLFRNSSGNTQLYRSPVFRSLDSTVRMIFNIQDFEILTYQTNRYYYLLITVLVTLPGQLIYVKNITINDIPKYNVEITADAQLNTQRIISCTTVKDVFRSLFSANNLNKENYNLTFDDGILDTEAVDDVLSSDLGLRGFEIQTINGGRYSMPTGAIVTSLEKYLQFLYIVYNIQLSVTYDKLLNLYNIKLAKFEDFYNNLYNIATFDSFNKLNFTINRDILYTGVTVGFDDSEDALNGKRDINRRLRYSKAPTREENILELVSPYNGAARTIETYIYDNYLNFDDTTEKDSNVYLLNVKFKLIDPNTNVKLYELNRVEFNNVVYPFWWVESESLYPENEWNLKFTPNQIILNHLRELSSYFALESDKLLQCRTRGNNFIIRKYTGDGEYTEWREDANIMLNGTPIFLPILTTFEAQSTSSLIADIYANAQGYFSLTNGLKGFISKGANSVVVNPMSQKANEFTLIVYELPT